MAADEILPPPSGARLASGLKVTGRADDGTVEAIEVPGGAFAVGVPWYPEENSQDVRLFAALVDAGQRYRQQARNVFISTEE